MDKTIYTEEHRAIVQKLIKARQESGLKQEDVAKLLNRTQSFVSKVEAGQKRIDVVELKELARIYNKPLGFFIQ
jgi:transcriptional regulator with XRE-family HTH domain